MSLKKIPPRVNPAPFYRKIIFTLVPIVVVVIGIVLYFSLVSAEIVIYPKKELSPLDFIVEVKDGNIGGETAASDILNGKIFTKDAEGSVTVEATGEKMAFSDDLGTVTIYNENTAEQTLVANTQLQGANTPIVRTRSQVTVPAGGYVSVAVYLSNGQKLDEGGIPPQKLTIIKLGDSLKTLIYAKNEATLNAGGHTIKVITQSDLDRALDALKNKLVEQAFTEMKGSIAVVGTGLAEESSVEIISPSFDGKVDEEKATVTASGKANVVGVIFSADALQTVAERKLRASLAADDDLVGFNDQSLKYNFDQYRTSDGLVVLKVYADGYKTLKEDSQALQKNRLRGLTKKEATDYLLGFDSIQNVQINMFPFWVSTIPKTDGKIEIVIKK